MVVFLLALNCAEGYFKVDTSSRQFIDTEGNNFRAAQNTFSLIFDTGRARIFHGVNIVSSVLQ